MGNHIPNRIKLTLEALKVTEDEIDECFDSMGTARLSKSPAGGPQYYWFVGKTYYGRKVTIDYFIDAANSTNVVSKVSEPTRRELDLNQNLH